jgi:radical SAM superfamily enzyme YgiQ (UPF0313 family)
LAPVKRRGRAEPPLWADREQADMLARVFPRRTKATPDDAYAFVGLPPAKLPEDVTEIAISVSFSYDIEEAERLYSAWAKIAPCSIGGPATGQRGEEFVPGKFVRQGYVITSRGCRAENACWFCEARKREGPVRALPVRDGANVLDDNRLRVRNFTLEKSLKCSKNRRNWATERFSPAGLRPPE